MDMKFEDMTVMELFKLKNEIEKEVEKRTKAKYAKLYAKVINAIEDILFYPDFENVATIDTGAEIITWEEIKKNLITTFENYYAD